MLIFDVKVYPFEVWKLPEQASIIWNINFSLDLICENIWIYLISFLSFVYLPHKVICPSTIFYWKLTINNIFSEKLYRKAPKVILKPLRSESCERSNEFSIKCKSVTAVIVLMHFIWNYFPNHVLYIIFKLKSHSFGAHKKHVSF